MGVNEKSERKKITSEMKKVAKEKDSRFWKDIAERLEKSKDNIAEVNVGKISRYASTGETVIVPGIVLGAGNVDEPINIAALYFTTSARKKIIEAGGKILSYEELMKENSKGTNVKIIG